MAMSGFDDKARQPREADLREVLGRSFALGEKAAAAAHAAGLPAAVLDVIDSATKYVEGRAVRFEVRARKDVQVVERVAEVKMQN